MADEHTKDIAIAPPRRGRGRPRKTIPIDPGPAAPKPPKRRGGRPPKYGEAKTREVAFKVTEHHHKRLMEMASQSGEHHADLIIRVLFSAAGATSKAPADGPRRHREGVFFAFAQLNKLVRQLNRAGGLMKHLHTQANPPDAQRSWRTIEKIERAVDRITEASERIPLEFIMDDDVVEPGSGSPASGPVP